MLENKKILVGLSGSIACYKTAELIREFIKKGAEVRVIATHSALEFITPLTLSTLSKNPVLSSFSNSDNGNWNNHVELGLWADAFVIAPATANTIAKCANGLCDNLLTAVYLSARCPVFIAPAMDLDMNLHPSTVANIEKLKSYGNHVIDSEVGELASGLIGKGRMAEPQNIAEYLINFFNSPKNNFFKKKKIMITAGPTFELIDPVRFVGNHSSGKMGVSIANEASKRGAEVHLILGPIDSALSIQKNINVYNVTSADEMYEQAKLIFNNSDIAIFAAAVADYKPKQTENHKIKKSESTLNISFVKNPDIAYELGKEKKENQITVGFALETENEVENAKEKLEKKNFDFVVLNSLNDKGAGFKSQTNKISIISKNKIANFELKSKNDVAKDILNEIASISK